ncbi:flavodoxin [uncultured Dubosiella sp.]|uniref:flavodoxin n=2 Tax=uncultured Dubosiella sp. TaxID=1937011 RepID=UPI00207E3942|nr:flavodoxin [uncultured Dubosiella sp.]GJM56348.1 hypothetical protein EROP_00410 [Erysipelotrichaceae bacterium OPF54]
MKKLTVLFLCVLLLSACSPKKAEKSMVVYYSENDGIEELATQIADDTDSELFRIVPKKDYSSLNEKIDKDEQLSAEEIKDLQSTSLLLEQSVPDQWNECDTVYIGFPLSSVTAAPAPVALFLSQNNLKNKTFIPFTIGTQDALGHARDSLTFDGAREGWKDGKAFSETYTEADIEEWLDMLSDK